MISFLKKGPRRGLIARRPPVKSATGNRSSGFLKRGKEAMMCTAVGFRASAENNHESRVQFVRIIILLIVNVIYKKKQIAKKLPNTSS